MKGKTKVLGEFGLEFIGYNLTRCASILGLKELCKALKKCCLNVFNFISWLFLNLFKPFIFGIPGNTNFSTNKLLPVQPL
jgi:hypothetical protein